jgi:hypothetical protein
MWVTGRDIGNQCDFAPGFQVGERIEYPCHNG